LAKVRIDVLLARKGLVESREKAKILVMAGAVYLGDERISRADRTVEEDTNLEVRSNPIPYVGYGGLKLAGAMEKFEILITGKVAADIGSSTGGFVDYLLQAGAARVYAIDVGTHQLHERLRTDSRVVVMENINARYLSADQIGESLDVVTVDVSFISLRKIIPPLVPLIVPGGTLITLVKPQFEVGRYEVGKGGIVKSEERILSVLEEIKVFGTEHGLKYLDTAEAPRDRDRKNREFFVLWER
jgi:23S rRNA (cytidine1920-2'-O)/16S rRNA (cytidine1409-2'-O)-methyltransferase